MRKLTKKEKAFLYEIHDEIYIRAVIGTISSIISTKPFVNLATLKALKKTLKKKYNVK